MWQSATAIAMGASSNSIRISADLFERACEQGSVMSRSAAQQVEHWARLGAALEAKGLSVDEMAELLRGSQQATEGELWAFKRERQARDLARVRSGLADNDQMSWFSKGRGKKAKLINSPL
jgi:hypothetical protein